MNKYDIAEEFKAGFACALRMGELPAPEKPSKYWEAGYNYGKPVKHWYNIALNEYLASIGVEEMRVIKPV